MSHANNNVLNMLAFATLIAARERHKNIVWRDINRRIIDIFHGISIDLIQFLMAIAFRT